MTRPIRSATRLLLALGLLALGLAAQGAFPSFSNHVDAKLLADVAAVVPGQPFQVGVQLHMDPEWHVYWKNPGDEAGLPTKVAWSLPAGLTAGELQWPTPKRLELPLAPGQPPIVNFGYGDTVMLLATITPAAELPRGTPVTVSAKVSWLACNEACIPGSANVTLTLPVAAAASPAPAETLAAFATARQALPATTFAWEATLSRAPGQYTLHLLPPSGYTGDPGKLAFMCEHKLVLDEVKPQVVAREGSGWSLTLPVLANAAALPDRLAGVLVAGNGWGTPGATAVQLDLPVSAAPAAAAQATPAAAAGSISLWKALLFALLGGLVLNLMPCVLPVLSLKVLDFVKQSAGDHSRAWRHGLVFTAGVLVSFWILTGVLFGLRAAGALLGWGFQLQSPGFVLALVALLFVFGLVLFGVFEPGLALTCVGGELSCRAGYSGSFFSGVLATVVATPCTGPFMASALGFSLAQPIPVAVLIFTVMGLGMALPYLVLASYPPLLRFVPKPGAWMETFKQFLGFLLMLTAAWLLWLLGAQVGNTALGVVLVGLVVLGLAAWVLGRWATPVRSARTRWMARVVAALLLVGGLGGSYLGLALYAQRPAADARAGAIAWVPFSADMLATYRQEGRPVFVDFTADWCLTCKFNERVAFTSEVGKALRHKGVVTMQADWTTRNDAITAELAKYGRGGVPLYLLFSGKADQPPKVLPQFLTESIVLEALEHL